MSIHIDPTQGRTWHNLPYDIWITDPAGEVLQSARTGGPEGWEASPQKTLLDLIGVAQQSGPKISGVITVPVNKAPVDFTYFFQPTEQDWMLHIDLATDPGNEGDTA